jgi:hypothetical protein
MWTHFYLSVKHGMLGNRGAWCVAEVVRRAVALEVLHLNLSYVPMGMAGHRALLAIPGSPAGGLRSCVIKLDSDMLDATDDESGPVQIVFFFATIKKQPVGVIVTTSDLEHLRLSLAFTAVLGFHRLQLGVRLRRLSLDLEGCQLKDGPAATRRQQLEGMSRRPETSHGFHMYVETAYWA